MLVLSRKSRESVVVGGSGGFEQLLKVTVLEIKDGRVRLGFEAGPDIPVHRWEVWERIRARGQPDIPMDGPAATVAG
jgi:carbon storage regulator CsrA